MAIAHSVSSSKTCESLFRTFVKAFCLQKTIIVFDNCSYNQEFSLKQQERINRTTNNTVRMYMGENAKEMSQGKACQQSLENTRNKLN